MAEASGGTTVVVPAFEMERIQIPIEGITPFYSHRFGENALSQIRDKQQGKAKAAGRKPKNPEDLGHQTLYIIESDACKYGILAIGFKKACVSACRFPGVDMPMTMARQAFFVRGVKGENEKRELVEILDSAPDIREDRVMLQGKTADLTYRAVFEDWRAVLSVEIVKGAISIEQMFNLVNIAGHTVGVGDWRPEKNGDMGRFRIQGETI